MNADFLIWTALFLLGLAMNYLIPGIYMQVVNLLVAALGVCFITEFDDWATAVNMFAWAMAFVAMNFAMGSKYSDEIKLVAVLGFLAHAFVIYLYKDTEALVVAVTAGYGTLFALGTLLYAEVTKNQSFGKYWLYPASVVFAALFGLIMWVI